MEDEIDIREYLGVLTRQWKVIVLIMAIMVIGAYLYSRSQRPIYEAKTTVLIKSSGSSSLSQYAGMASMLGINLSGGGNNLGDLTEIMKSRAVAFKVLDDLKLTKRIKGWNDPKLNKQDLASSVGGMLKAPRTSGNMVEIKAESDDPQLAADLANGYVSALSYYWNELNYTESQKKLKYIESELPRVEGDLRVVESKLKLVPRSASGISFGQNVGVSGLQRDYEIYNSVYIMLKKELESTKLEASKDIPPFSVVDMALKPNAPIKPKVRLNIMIGLVLGVFCGISVAVLREYWEKTADR